VMGAGSAAERKAKTEEMMDAVGRLLKNR
jgi:hypothetical protein